MSKEPTPTPLPRFTITAKTWRDLVEPVLPCAGRDDMLPILTCVKFTVLPDRIVAVATDRFRAGMSTVPLNISEDSDAQAVPGSFVLRAASVRRILTLFKPTRYADPDIQMQVQASSARAVGDDHQQLNVEAVGGLHVAAAMRISFDLDTGQFPNIGEVITKAIQNAPDPTATNGYGVNGAFLADFKAAVRDGQPLVLHPGDPKKGIGITCGEHFAGVLMTRRLYEGSEGDSLRRTDWAALAEHIAEARKEQAA